MITSENKNSKETSKKPSAGDTIQIENSSVCTPSMGGYPDYVYRNIKICEDGYQLEGYVTDMLGHINSQSKAYIEKGFFAKSSFSEIANRLNNVVCYISTTPWSISENKQLMQLIMHERKSINGNISNINALIFNMRTNWGKKYEFLYSGYMMRNHNKYGSFDWFYLCEMQGKNYILIFSDRAIRGTIWKCLEITDRESEVLASAELPLWLEIIFAARKTNNKIKRIHLEKLNDIKYLLPQYLRGNCITDADYYGRSL